MEMKYYTLKQEDDPATFVEFWARRYKYRDPKIYQENIKPPLTPESVRKLFAWKAMQLNSKTGVYKMLTQLSSCVLIFCRV
jgi:hypothetical protein